MTSVPYFNLADRISGNSFSYVQCTQCKTIYLSPQLTATQILDYYPVEYEPYQRSSRLGTKAIFSRYLSSQRVQLNFVERFAKQRGCLLDIGCATGDFLDTANRRGWEVTGIEIVESVATYTRETRGFDVRQEQISNTSLPDGTYQAITLWDVLEHLPEPDQALQRCYQLLAPGGYLFFSIPNLNSIDRFLFGKTWIGWDPPRHFHLFTNASVHLMLARSGFELVHSQCIVGGKGAFLLSLEVAFGKSKFGSILKRLFPLISVVTFPYRRIAYLMNRGPLITYIFQKPFSKS